MASEPEPKYCAAMESLVSGHFSIVRIRCPKSTGQPVYERDGTKTIPFKVQLSGMAGEGTKWITTDAGNCNDPCPVPSGEVSLNKNGDNSLRNFLETRGATIQEGHALSTIDTNKATAVVVYQNGRATTFSRPKA